ncbi:RIP metalloprotease RseP [Sphingomonas prati]|uniref:Zinc metalloprotease n=1 Tax=Sphingomonas prati TaxID=1843237 RepID=A0A7W9BR16_9SPHN|nr:RIP metalloprotease RseP [Sphingomonas prati]MBB5728549.1 regulator of sigma E protease [Sphingomonas prati]GGE72904.1 zinc metalloprotease [Sphingomonas prati]
MMQSPGIALTVLSFFLLIGPLIFIHEMGHYLAGRAFGVKADTFSIGFGRELFGWTDRRGTRWRVALLPLGGYVKFAGDMNPASVPTPAWLALPPAERAMTFQAKPVWQRFLIVAAGPAINFALAVLIFMTIFAVVGEGRTPSTVAAVLPGSAAAQAGVRAGDRITMIASQGVYRFEDIGDLVRHRAGETLKMDVYRGQQQIHLLVTPETDLQRDRFGNEFRIGMLGIAAGKQVKVPLRFSELPGAAARQTVLITRTMVDTLWQIVSGRRSVRELGGPLQIARLSGQVATLGWLDFVYFMAAISINLGFMNLLPIPMLDGGHLFFYLIEAVRRKPLAPVAQEWAFRSGLALLLTFMVFVTVNDLGSFGLWRQLAGLIG